MPFRFTSVLIPILLIIISSCGTKTTEEVMIRPKLDIRLSEGELDSLKSFIIDQYWKYDSVYFSPSDNCYFRQFVENELEVFGYYYDTVYQGISIKHYSFPYTHFQFNLVRGSDGRFYYVGLSDWEYIIRNIIKDYYVENESYSYDFKYSDHSFLDINSSTQTALNNVLQNDTLFNYKNSNRMRDRYWKRSVAEGFVFHNYKMHREGGGYPLVPIFGKTLGPTDVKLSMEKLKGGKLSDNELIAGEKYGKLTYYFTNERANLYELDDLGILAFHFTDGNGAVQIQQSFFPAKTRDIIGYPCTIIDWSLYKECRDLPNDSGN